MRVAVCTEFENRLLKLAVVHETEQGIYFAICNTKADLHASYHVDGHRHVKLRRSRVEQSTSLGTPIRDIETHQQILSLTATFLKESIETAAPLRRARHDNMLFLSSVLSGAGSSITINAFMVHRRHEIEFISTSMANYSDSHFELLAPNTFGMHQFRDHRIGLIVYRGVQRELPNQRT